MADKPTKEKKEEKKEAIEVHTEFSKEELEKNDKPPKKEEAIKKSNSLSFVFAIAVIIVLLFFSPTIFKSAKNLITGYTTSNVVIASVNGYEITGDFIDSQYNILSPQFRAFISKEMLLNQTITEELLIQEAKKNGLTVTNDEVRKAIEEALLQNSMSYDDFKEKLKQEGIDINDAELLYERQLYITKLLDSSIAIKSDISIEDIEEYYVSNLDDFVADEGIEVRASHILVSTEEEANKILEELRNGKDFSVLAEEKSIDPSARFNKGSLGIFGKGVMVKEFEDSAFSLEQGEISEPVMTQFGYHIIKRETNILPFDDVKDDINNTLSTQKQSELLMVFVEDLRSKADIKIFKDFKEQGQETPLESIEFNLPDDTIDDTTEEDITETEDITPSQEIDCSSEKTPIFYYGNWCNTCLSLKEELESENLNIKFVEDSPKNIVDDCFSDIKELAYPQLICPESKEVISGTLSVERIKSFVESCQ